MGSITYQIVGKADQSLKRRPNDEAGWHGIKLPQPASLHGTREQRGNKWASLKGNKWASLRGNKWASVRGNKWASVRRNKWASVRGNKWASVGKGEGGIISGHKWEGGGGRAYTERGLGKGKHRKSA